MPNDDLFTWFQERPEWQRALAATLTTAPELDDGAYARFRTALRQEHKLEEGSPAAWQPLTRVQLKSDAASAPVTILGSIGPLKNIDRLAANQPPLRFAKAGITLIYGANGSGKSGYCRIAKKLCRCLHEVSLRGNVYEAANANPREIDLSFGVDGNAKTEVTWRDDSDPPEELGRISVFDSDAAGIYADSERNIEFMPFELSLMTKFVAALKKLEAGFQEDLNQLKSVLRTPLPGFGADTSPGRLIEQLSRRDTLPTAEQIKAVGTWSAELEAELDDLVLKSKSDPALLLQITKALTATTAELIDDVMEACDLVGDKNLAEVRAEREKARETRAAAKAVMDGILVDAAVPNLGNEMWRQMLSYARSFAAEAFPDATPPQVAEADVCVLCHQPLGDAVKERLRKFDAYLSSRANEDADKAQKILTESVQAIRNAKFASVDELSKRFTGYIEGAPDRAILVDRVIVLMEVAKARSEAIVNAFKSQEDAAFERLPELDGNLVEDLSSYHEALKTRAASLQATPEQQAAQARTKARIAELEARKRFSAECEIFLQRLATLQEYHKTEACMAACASGPVTAHITRIRRQTLTQTLKTNLQDEVKALALEHLPLSLSDRAQAGVSKVQIGLETLQPVRRNSDVLSEGEKRALALAGFLAEIKEIGPRHGIIIDDPVSSLDHSRIEAVAKRLVEEARTGRQVVIFTHNLVFHHAICAAARGVHLRKEWIAKHPDGRFGVIDEAQMPWIYMKCTKRLEIIQKRIADHRASYSEADETNRPFITDVYTKLRETWEHSIEEILFAGVINRFRPDIQTLKLRGAKIEDSDYAAVYAGMTQCSKFSGHDQAAGSPPDLPSLTQIVSDFTTLKQFVATTDQRRKTLSSANQAAYEEPLEAELL